MASQKDYLEHIRTIHFTLLAASVGLLIVASTHQPSLANRAHTELRELLRLKEDLPKVQDAIREVVVRSGQKSDLQVDPRANGMRFVVAGQQVSFPIIFDSPEWVLLPETDDISPIQFRSLPDMDSVGATQRLWQWMSHDFTVNIAQGLSQPGYIINFDSPSTVKVYPVNYELVHLEHIANPKHIAIEALPFRTSNIANPDYRRLSGTKAAYTLFFDYSDFDIKPLGDTSNLDGHFPVKLSTVGHIDLLGAWISSHPQLTHGTFAANFPAITQLGAGYEGLELSNLEKLISQEEQLAETPTDSFEAFGMKFPASDALRWGGGILLAIQLYLLFTINESDRVLAVSKHDIETPWIGIYKSTCACVLTILTATLLPMIGIVSVGLQARATSDRHYLNSTILAFSIIVEAAFLIALIRAVARMRRSAGLGPSSPDAPTSKG